MAARRSAPLRRSELWLHLRLFILVDRRPLQKLWSVSASTCWSPMVDVLKPAVIEEVANDQAAVGSSLKLRIRQKEVLAELGVLSMQGTPFPELLSETASLVAEGLEAEFCKVLEYRRQEARFLVTAG